MKKIIVLALVFCMLLCTACSVNKDAEDVLGTDTTDIGEVTQEVTPKEDVEVTLYYSDNQGTGLHKEARTLSYDDAHNPEAVLKELFKGTQNTSFTNVIPDTVTINSCTLEDGICTVDLSVDFIEIQGTAAQEMAMYSIVNTLCEMEEVDKVQYLIDGEKVELFGYFDLASPFEADMTFVAD